MNRLNFIMQKVVDKKMKDRKSVFKRQGTLLHWVFWEIVPENRT